MRYSVFLILVLFILASCKQTNSDIIGTWISVDKNSSSGFEFFEDGKVDNLLGFYASKNKDEKFYLGNLSQYRYENDTLSIYDLGDETWHKYYVKLNFDTLQLVGDQEYVFTKFKDEIDEKSESPFYEIILYKPEIHGTSSTDRYSYYISIDKSGRMTKYDSYKPDSIYIYELSEEQLNRINKLYARFEPYEKCLLDSVGSKSYGLGSPLQMSVVKDGKLFTFEPSMNQCAGNNFFLQFFYSTIYLNRIVSVDEVEAKNILFDIKNSRNYFFYFRYVNDETKAIYLTYTESYYLWNLLQKAKTVDVKFEEKYVLDSSYETQELSVDELIYTDGRYYRYKDKIVDLGYNFIEKNGFDKAFVNRKNVVGGFVPPIINGITQ